jgi:hypothetical protein
MAYNGKSLGKCIESNDLMGCYENYQHSTPRWSDYWWSGVIAIYNNGGWHTEFEIDNLLGTLTLKQKIIVNNTNRVEYKRFRNGKQAVRMEFMEDCGENIQGKETVYFFKFYSNNELLFNKIGTTTRNVISRLKEEIGYYSNSFDLTKVEIHRIVDCGEYPAEGAESVLRAELIKQYPKAFRKNDRFFNVDISPNFFDQILNNYLA